MTCAQCETCDTIIMKLATIFVALTPDVRKQGDQRSPMEMLREEPPKKVSGLRVASTGGDGDDHEGLGCPIEYIDLRGTTADKPAVCKYTGNKYYSDDWRGGGMH